MELAKLLELLYSAVDRSDTVRATIHGGIPEHSPRAASSLRSRALE
jgi:hypothetical protein